MSGEGAFVRYNNIGKAGAGEVSVTVVIPVYRTALTAGEEQSLEQCCRALAAYPKALVKPCGLDVSTLLAKMSAFESSVNKAPAVEEFDAAHFANVEAYSRLLLSAEFYERFLTTRYILIYQLDAYVFRDELEEWCTKGYACTGAPFMLRSFPFQLHIDRRLLGQLAVRWKYWLQYHRMSNGGLSLRQTAVFYDLASRYAEQFARLAKAGTLLPEDIVWNGLLARLGYPLPSFRQKLSFAFDTNPRLCYLLSGKTLPFGCHAWSKRRHQGFWKQFIPPHAPPRQK